MAEQNPSDFFLQRAYQDSFRHQTFLADEYDRALAMYRKRGDFVGGYLEARLLMYANPRASRATLESMLKEHPEFPWPHLEFVEWGSLPGSRTSADAAAHREAFFDGCPETYVAGVRGFTPDATIMRLIDADGVDLAERPVFQTPGHDMFDRIENLGPRMYERPPPSLSMTAAAPNELGRAYTLWSMYVCRRPRELLRQRQRHSGDSRRAAWCTEEDEKPPQGDELKAPLGELVVTGRRQMAARADCGRTLARRIFAPLGMTRTLLHVNGVNTVPNRAYGHSRRNDKYVETDQSSSSATQGDGGIYSNLQDLAKWDDALRTHRLLSRVEMAPAMVPVTLSNGATTCWPATPGGDNLLAGKPVAYGYGWFLDPLGTHPRMWHSGTTMGFRTAIERLPEDGLTVVVLANRSDLDAAALAEQTAQTALRRR